MKLNSQYFRYLLIAIVLFLMIGSLFYSFRIAVVLRGESDMKIIQLSLGAFSYEVLHSGGHAKVNDKSVYLIDLSKSEVTLRLNQKLFDCILERQLPRYLEINDIYFARPDENITEFNAVIIPFWILITVLLIPEFIIYYRYRMSLYRINRGLCGYCGYDLSESKERCPECGKKIDILRPSDK